MSDVLSLTEIEECFAGRWVLIGEPETNALLELKGGSLLFHSQDREEVHRRRVALRPPRFALLYVGSRPEGREFALLDSASDRQMPDNGTPPRGHGHVGWLVALTLAGFVYLETANAPLSVAAACVKAGWNELSSGWWLFRSDPLRPRARACFWFYLAASLWKIAACAFVAGFLCGLMVGPQGNAAVHLPTSLSRQE